MISGSLYWTASKIAEGTECSALPEQKGLNHDTDGITDAYTGGVLRKIR